MMPIKSPEDMQLEYAKNVEDGAQEIVRQALAEYAKYGKLAAISIYHKPVASVQIAASRLNDAGWAVEYGHSKNEGTILAALSISSRQDYINRKVKKYGERTLYSMSASAAVVLATLLLIVAFGAALPLIVLLLVAGAALAYTTLLFYNRAAQQQMLSAKLSDGRWQAVKVTRVSTD